MIKPLAIGLLALLAGCSDMPSNSSSGPLPPRAIADRPIGDNPPVGADCIVQFKRDLLGGTNATPISPTTTNQNGADLTVQGTLVKIDSDWVVIKDAMHATHLWWIPRQNVLMLSFQ